MSFIMCMSGMYHQLIMCHLYVERRIESSALEYFLTNFLKLLCPWSRALGQWALWLRAYTHQFTTEYVYCNMIEKCILTYRVGQKPLCFCSTNNKTAPFSILRSMWLEACAVTNCPFLKQYIEVLGLPGSISWFTIVHSDFVFYLFVCHFL